MIPGNPPMNVLRVRDWTLHFEHGDMKKVHRMSWVKLPTKQEGDGYRTLIAHERGWAHFGVWNAVLQLAAKCPVRGTLIRDLGYALVPHDPASISRIIGADPALVAEAIPRLLETGWLEEVPVEAADLPKPSAVLPKSSDDVGRKDVLQLQGQGQGERQGTPSSPPPSPPATPTTPGKARKVVGIDSAAARRAVESNDLVAVIRAYGGNLAGERAAEWARDCHGKTLHTVAVVLGWQFRMTKPIREPSGFRKAWELWVGDLNDEERRHLSVEEMARIGIEVHIAAPPVPA